MNTSVSDAIKTENIASIFQEIKNEDNEVFKEKTLDLFNKLEKNEFVICFSGHFSAGKSSLINRLLGEDILPQSPIPTSANVVKLTAGEGFVRVFFNYEDPIEYREPYDLETIKDYCKDGDSIKRIEISKKDTVIPTNVSILDTPGIDSSNDADRIMTESSLHLVDALFYVMDYNHVQSEVNLSFLKKMQAQNKPIYIVINQIDKHQEEEIAFSDFKTSVTETLQNWEIYPQSVYYTSLIAPHIPLNQYETLQKDLSDLMNSNLDTVEQTVENSMQTLINQHIDWLQVLNEEKKEILKEQLVDFNHKLVDSDSTQQKKELARLTTLVATAKKDFLNSLNSTLKNAYIMPFELRELADSFLRTQQPGFKLGMFSTKKKIELEKINRLDNFYNSLMESVKTNIEWKLRDKLLELTKKYSLNDSEYSNRIHSLSITYSKWRLKEIIKTGAIFTGEYLLIYTEDVSKDIKSEFKHECLLIWDSVQSSLERETNDNISAINIDLANREKVEKIKSELHQVDNDLETKKRNLQNLLIYKQSSDKVNVTDVKKEIELRKELVKINHKKMEYADQRIETPEIVKENDNSKNKNRNAPMMNTINNITDTIATIKNIPGFKVIEQDLAQKREKLVNKDYTIALFGAFSAGKSSFANALIGEKVLPVSPNPTTAAINKISPIDEDHKHGTVIVKVKSQERLLLDISAIADETITSKKTLNEYLEGFKQEKDQQQLDHKYHSFLSALADGYQKMSSDLGGQISIRLEQFSDFVAKEHLACYVEWLELFYDCPLTIKGITLVDTPGADSINARHTDVSFNYIKNADAILFVTYYNHAFSKADREFLVQLGRVKDAFSLDKMFFVVNAADLAKDKTELQMVTNYVTNQLSDFGIRHPRMYPISSKQALIEKSNSKQDVNSGLKPFEDDFYHFIRDELMALLIASAENDMIRAKKLLKSYLKAAYLDNDEKELMYKEYEKQQLHVIEKIDNLNDKPYQKEVEQKIDKQVFYVNHRLSIQFSDYYKHSFNPSTIKNKTDLEHCLQQLIKDVGYELAQELRAVSLRIELFINQKATEFNQTLSTKSSETDKELTLSEFQQYTFETPIFESAFLNLDTSVFYKALAIFKNTKSFFEKNEKEAMKDEIFNILSPYVQSYLSSQKEKIILTYKQQWERLTDDIRTSARLSINQYYDGLTHSLSNKVNMEELQAAVSKLEDLSSDLNT
ncbi:dynamin family protein [Aquibacillus saliphilus]|uniref:dynamin family protein n=1 Tax=Aquibacillus saliphilus TaxID=1909422 RepID=UPI001CF078C5|nr:dynamin family protein [Aquibacillus saliphilus]